MDDQALRDFISDLRKLGVEHARRQVFGAGVIGLGDTRVCPGGWGAGGPKVTQAGSNP